jgi:hypothetical protein
MNHRQKSPPRRPPSPAYRQAFERLDAALAKNSRLGEDEKIQMARIALFGEEAVGGIRPGENSGMNTA